MRRSPSAAAGQVSAKLLLSLTLLASLGGCSGDTPVDPYGVRRVAIALVSDTLRPGQVLRGSAIALNGAGEVVDAPVRWQSVTPAKLLVDSTGTLRALAPGVGIVRAFAGNVVAERALQLVNPPTATIVPNVDSLALTLPGVPVQLSATPLDAAGIPIVGAELSWQSAAARIVSVNGLGVIAPVAVGRTVVRVSVDAVSHAIPVRVTPAVIATAPNIVSVSPSLIGPGTTFTLSGSQLQLAGEQPRVFVDGRAAQLLSATDSMITAVLSGSTLPCLPTADVSVQVSTSGGVGAVAAQLQLAPQRALAVGEALILSGATDVRCLELPGEGRYLVSVLNTARAIGAGSVDVTLDALTGPGDAVSSVAPSVLTPAEASALRVSRAHAEVLDASRRAVEQRPAGTVHPELQVAPAGGLNAIRVPNLDAANICTNFRAIHARTVYEGSHVYIVEDTTSQLAGTPLLRGAMDADLRALGAEIDNVIWPIITRFGDPLVMDSRLDANGRIVIALTPALNAMRGGAVLGAVVTCDFYSRAQFASSNVGEILYLQVPTLAGGIDSATALARWRHAIRGTVAHELKHVVSFAEHIVRNLPLEEVWLEEATAQHAEELFTRAITGVTATANTAYASIRCEVLAAQGDGSCAGTPALMKPTFDALWDFLDAPALRSPLGAMSAADYSFYGSGWSLLRWAMDHAATPEALFTQQLTVSGQSGVANLEARSGFSWEQMLGRWSLAVATDGRPVTLPADPSLRYPSWDLSSIFAGLCTDLGPCGGSIAFGSRYSRAHPLQPLAPGTEFALRIPELAPAGFQFVEARPGSAGSRRFLRLRAVDGTAGPPAARLAILRIN